MVTTRRQVGSRIVAEYPGDGTVTEKSELWDMAATLRGGMDAEDYKHAVLGLIFLKYVSDTFEETHARLKTDPDADPEEQDEYRALNIFWVPPEARWPNIMKHARQSSIGQAVDNAMASVGEANHVLKNALPKNYGRLYADNDRLGHIINLIGNIGIGGKKPYSKGTLGQAYEYFLSRFTSAEGKRGGGFYTPRSVVRLLVEMLEPYGGRIYDPCCGSSGMLIQAMEFVRAHAAGNSSDGKVGADISIHGQEINPATWRLAKMNLAIRGMECGRIAHGDSLCNDCHPDLRADFILTNPPFGVSWRGEGDSLPEDSRWKYGVPPKGNADFAWVQHAVHHLTPTGKAGLVLTNGSMSSNRSGEGDIRRNLVDADLVDCMVALPGQLFYSTQMPACLWFMSGGRAGRKRSGKVLFIDARRMGRMIDRTRRVLADGDIDRIACAYHAWLGSGKHKYADEPGFCRSVTLAGVRKHNHVLTPGHYVGTEPRPTGGEPFEKKLSSLAARWDEQCAEAKRLDAAIKRNLKKLGVPVRGVGA